MSILMGQGMCSVLLIVKGKFYFSLCRWNLTLVLMIFSSNLGSISPQTLASSPAGLDCFRCASGFACKHLGSADFLSCSAPILLTPRRSPWWSSHHLVLDGCRSEPLFCYLPPPILRYFNPSHDPVKAPHCELLSCCLGLDYSIQKGMATPRGPSGWNYSHSVVYSYM
jgi:hypothetical protein